jgi:DNA-nicking Smr family endonuclease
MKKNSEQPAASDADLFQQAVDGVIPISPSNRILPSRPVKSALRHNPSISALPVKDNWTDHGNTEVAPTSFLRAGLNSMTLRKLRRGHWPVQDEIDLHGLTTEEARGVLLNFLQQALRNHYRCINVIHGKGWRADGSEGILKLRVRHWLSQFPQVLAFCEPPANAGGGGAVWLLLAAKVKDGSSK